MIGYSPRQYVEQFHLLFLAQLGLKLDKRFYALKGGCNLRFFLRSFRYSEDIDLDACSITKDKLENIVNGILESKPFADILRTRNMTIQHTSSPKQTETTQRWKLGLATPLDMTLHTKIEFSRRGMGGNTLFEAIDPTIIMAYRSHPIMINHYHAEAAYEQKIEALIMRTTTQSRDIFDLNLLINSGVNTQIENDRLRSRIKEAQSNAMRISYDVFKSQVLSFLIPEYQAQYDSRQVWEDMVLKLVETLEQQ